LSGHPQCVSPMGAVGQRHQLVRVVAIATACHVTNLPNKTTGGESLKRTQGRIDVAHGLHRQRNVPPTNKVLATPLEHQRQETMKAEWKRIVQRHGHALALCRQVLPPGVVDHTVRGDKEANEPDGSTINGCPSVQAQCTRRRAIRRSPSSSPRGALRLESKWAHLRDACRLHTSEVDSTRAEVHHLDPSSSVSTSAACCRPSAASLAAHSRSTGSIVCCGKNSGRKHTARSQREATCACTTSTEVDAARHLM